MKQIFIVFDRCSEKMFVKRFSKIRLVPYSPLGYFLLPIFYFSTYKTLVSENKLVTMIGYNNFKPVYHQSDQT